MSRRGRGNRVKKTVIYRGLFGEKHVETRWVNEGTGCGGVLLVIFVLMMVFRGC